VQLAAKSVTPKRAARRRTSPIRPPHSQGFRAVYMLGPFSRCRATMSVDRKSENGPW
jgi:hypothetical protein